MTEEAELTIPLLKIGEDIERYQAKRLKTLRAERNQAACDKALEGLRQACRDGTNTMPHILECAREYCTLYEIRRALEDVFGAYREPVFF